MSKFASFEQIILDQMSIPTKLLTSYKSLDLNEKEVMLIIQIYRFLLKNIEFPTPDQLASYVTMDEKECASMLRYLIQKGVLTIEQNENEDQQISESYSLEPLFEKLYTKRQTSNENTGGEGSLFLLFEQEFGRPLSPFEIETINVWLDEDQQSPALIKAALRESVLMGKLNFKYLDRILREWKKKGVQTVEQARNASKGFHQKQTRYTEENAKKRDTSFYYNWLEGEE
ncbi:DnaD domain-containing protein [Oceanobacillus halotolerans]|uniref:DnaD domain-containing protein n=1 Tax=Oceanobacillus halotolerans TaxID=2663380 RepID=UPI0013DBB1FE|nr:DnaD domain-containing protein [Oceanobacillus halotolerans]